MPTPLAVEGESSDLRTMVEDYERQLIVSALSACAGQKSRTARALRVLPSTLHEKIKRLGIESDRTDVLPPGARSIALGPKQEFGWRGRLEAGSTLEVRAMNGTIRASAAAGDDAEVVALHEGRLGRQLAIGVLEHGGGVLFTVYEPAAPRAGRGSPVDFRLRIPRGVSLAARLLSGNIEIAGVRERIDASTQSGQVRLFAANENEGAMNPAAGSRHSPL